MAVADGCTAELAVSFTPAMARAVFLWHVGYRYGDYTTWSLSCNDAVGFGYLTDDTATLAPIFLSNGALNSSSTYAFGPTSAYFPSGSYAGIEAGSSDIALNGDFTFECWIRPDSSSDNRIVHFSSGTVYVSAYLGKWTLKANTSTVQSTIDVSLTEWTHIALCRSANVIRLFVNGVSAASVVYSGALSLYQLCGSGARIDSIGFAKAYAKYSTDFAEPTRPFYVDETTERAIILEQYALIGGEAAGSLLTPTEYDANWDRTAILIRGGGSDGSKVVISEKNTYVNNRNDKAVYVSGESKYASSSLYFNGSDAYLMFSPSWQADFSRGDFTLELWVKPTLFGSERGLVTHWSNFKSWKLMLNTNGSVSFHFYDPAVSQTVTITSPLISLNEWSFIAVTRTGSVYRIWANGVLGASVNTPYVPAKVASYSWTGGDGSTINRTDAAILVGAYGHWGAPVSTAYFKGYIEDVRVTGVSRYTTDDGFVPLRAFVPTGNGSEGDVYWNDVQLAVSFVEPDGTVYGVRDARGHSLNLLNRFLGRTVVSKYRELYSSFAGIYQAGWCGMNGGFLFAAGGDGTSGDGAMSIPYGSEFDFTTGDFTIEFYVMSPTRDNKPLFSWYDRNASPQKGILIYPAEASAYTASYDFHGYIVYSQWSSTGVQDLVLGPPNSLSYDRWHHVAVVRKNNTVTVFVDGVSGTPSTLTRYPGNPNQDLYYNTWNDPEYYDSGAYLPGPIRITRSARYNSNFTPLAGRWPEQIASFGNVVISETVRFEPGSPKAAITVDGALVDLDYRLEIPKVVSPTLNLYASLSAYGAATGGEGADELLLLQDVLMTRQSSSASEGVGIGDEASCQYVASASDSVAFSDALTVSLGNVRATDGINLSGAWSAAALMPMSQTDTVSLSESVTTATKTTLSEACALSSSATLSRNVSLADKIYINDIHGTLFTFNTSLIEALLLSDAHTSSAKLAYGAEVSSAISLGASTTALRRVLSSFIEQLGFSDAASIGAYLVIEVQDDVSFRGDILPAQLLYLVVNEGIALAAYFTSPTFTTWVMNTRTTAVSQYDGYQFNSFVQVGERYLGANETGLYWLDGDTDAGIPVQPVFQPGVIQPHGNKLANVLYAYLGMRGDGSFNITITDEAGGAYTYKLDAQSMKTGRVSFGKGLRTRYFTFRVEGDGKDFDLDNVEFVTTETSRKIQR